MLFTSSHLKATEVESTTGNSKENHPSSVELNVYEDFWISYTHHLRDTNFVLSLGHQLENFNRIEFRCGIQSHLFKIPIEMFLFNHDRQISKNKNIDSFQNIRLLEKSTNLSLGAWYHLRLPMLKEWFFPLSAGLSYPLKSQEIFQSEDVRINQNTPKQFSTYLRIGVGYDL